MFLGQMTSPMSETVASVVPPDAGPNGSCKSSWHTAPKGTSLRGPEDVDSNSNPHGQVTWTWSQAHPWSLG